MDYQIYTGLKEKVTQSTVSLKLDLCVKMADVPPLCLIHLKAHMCVRNQPRGARC